MQTTKHLGHSWYAMVKICETIFAQSKLVVYKNFEKSYNTYRWARGGDAEAIKLQLDATTVASRSASTIVNAEATATKEAT